MAILPLLTACRWNGDGLYLEKLIAATRLQAVNYPLFLQREARLLKPLTTAQGQVLKLLCHNKSNQEICDILGVQLATVKAHVSQILKKLGVSRRSEAKEAAEKNRADLGRNDDEQNAMVRLSPQAAIVKNQKQIGVFVGGFMLWAKGNVQTAILSEIADRPKSVEELVFLAKCIRDGLAGAEYDALALAEFILTFGNAIADK